MPDDRSNNLTLTVAQANGVVSIIGEGVHTALRKYVDSPQSAVAWHAINHLPDKEWTVCCQMAAAQVLRYLSASQDMDANVRRLLHKWDGM